MADIISRLKEKPQTLSSDLVSSPLQSKKPEIASIRVLSITIASVLSDTLETHLQDLTRAFADNMCGAKLLGAGAVSSPLHLLPAQCPAQSGHSWVYCEWMVEWP